MTVEKIDDENVDIKWSGVSLSSEKLEISYCQIDDSEKVIVESLDKSERKFCMKIENVADQKWLVAIRASNSLGFGAAKYVIF